MIKRKPEYIPKDKYWFTSFCQYEVKYTVDYKFMLMYTVTKDSKQKIVSDLKAKNPRKKVEIISIKKVEYISKKRIDKILKEDK